MGEKKTPAAGRRRSNPRGGACGRPAQLAGRCDRLSHWPARGMAPLPWVESVRGGSENDPGFSLPHPLGLYPSRCATAAVHQKWTAQISAEGGSWRTAPMGRIQVPACPSVLGL
jgi:hypothetical protein